MFRSFAIIIGPVIAALILVLGALHADKEVWSALAAIGTISAVVVAIFYPFFLEWIKRPKLEIGLYVSQSPHLRKTPLTKDGMPVPNVSLYPLSIRLKNTGKMLAKNAQPQITAMGQKENGRWKVPENWIDAPVQWGLDEYALMTTGQPTEEKNLVPERSYFFNLGALRTDRPDDFFLSATLMPGGQKSIYTPGEFCFELTVYAEAAKSAKKYFHFNWHGGCSDNFEDVKKRITIKVKDKSPW